MTHSKTGLPVNTSNSLEKKLSHWILLHFFMYFLWGSAAIRTNKMLRSHNLKELTEKRTYMYFNQYLPRIRQIFARVFAQYESLVLVTTMLSHNTVDTEGNPAQWHNCPRHQFMSAMLLLSSHEPLGCQDFVPRAAWEPCKRPGRRAKTAFAARLELSPRLYWVTAPHLFPKERRQNNSGLYRQPFQPYWTSWSRLVFEYAFPT